MPDWAVVIAMKIVAAWFLAALYYFGLLRPLEWIRRRLPDARWVDVLFRERGTGGASKPARPPNDGLKQRAIGRR